jgi:hypothetical protein
MQEPIIRGGHSETSPDGAWSLSIVDGPISTGELGVTLRLYRGKEPNTLGDKAPDLVFETPLKHFDARHPETDMQWDTSSRSWSVTLAAPTMDGAHLKVIPESSAIIHYPSILPSPSRATPLFGWTSWILSGLLALSLLWILLKKLRTIESR